MDHTSDPLRNRLRGPVEALWASSPLRATALRCSGDVLAPRAVLINYDDVDLPVLPTAFPLFSAISEFFGPPPPGVPVRLGHPGARDITELVARHCTIARSLGCET